MLATRASMTGWNGDRATGSIEWRNFSNTCCPVVTVGAIYALVALGFTLIYNASDVVNFAQGEFVMIGGMITFFAVAAGISAAACGVARAGRLAFWSACCCNRLAIEPAKRASPCRQLIIITIGASIFLRGVAAARLRQAAIIRYPELRGHGADPGLAATILPQSLMGASAARSSIVLALWLLRHPHA
jgi:branched-chain amino acid transport system permease protein